MTKPLSKSLSLFLSLFKIAFIYCENATLGRIWISV